MKKYLSDFFPKKLNDVSFWLLSIVVVFPILRMFIDYDYMIMNFTFLCLCTIYFLVNFVMKIIKGKKMYKIKSCAFFWLLIMLLLMFIGSFFSYNPKATWLGIFRDHHQEISVFQFAFFVLIATLGILLDKGNIKALIYEFITVALIIICIHIANQKYYISFVNRNFAGYYLCTTLTLSVCLLLFSENIFESIYLSIATVMHFIILVLNGSFGPILAVLCYLVVGFIYFLIHKRYLIFRFITICLACFSIFSIFDFVPKLSKYKCEKQTIIDQLYDVSFVVLNKVGIIDKKTFEKIEQGVDNEGNKKDDVVVGGSVIIQSGITAGAKGYDRFDMWERCLDNMKERPLFGVGAGAWWTYNPDMPNSHPHNEYLQIGSSFGIPVLSIYVGVIIYILIKFRIKHKKCSNLAFVVCGAMIVYLIQAFFGILQPFTAQLSFLLIGLTIKFVDKKDEDEIEYYNLKLERKLNSNIRKIKN